MWRSLPIDIPPSMPVDWDGAGQDGRITGDNAGQVKAKLSVPEERKIGVAETY